MSTATARSPAQRRRLQFRLRTLLATMFVIGLGLGFWSVYIRPYQQEARIIAQLQEHGAVVTTGTEGPGLLRAIAGDAFFRRIVKVELDDSATLDEDLRLLTRAPRLRSVVIVFGNDVGPESALRHLREMKSLLELYCLSGSVTISGAGVEHGAPPTDKTLRHIGPCRQLRILVVEGAFTDEGVAHLAGLSQCQSLSLASLHWTDSGLAPLGSLTSLMDLHLYGPITDAGMSHLEPLKSLESLTCEGDPEKSVILSSLESGTQFDLIDAPLIDVVEYLSELHEIQIRLDQEEIETAGIDPLAPITAKGANIPLRNVISQICETWQLDYIIGKDEIVMTTPAASAPTRKGVAALKEKLPKLKTVNVQW